MQNDIAERLRNSEAISHLVCGLSRQGVEELIDCLEQEVLEELAGRLHRQAERVNVEVYLTGQMKSFRVESVCTNGPIIQINVGKCEI